MVSNTEGIILEDETMDSELEQETEQPENTPQQPVCQRILNIECDIKRIINISIVYEDNTRKEVAVSKGDKVQVTYVNEAKLETVRGLILNILRGPRVLNRITNKMQYEYCLKLDCSTRYGSNTRMVYCELIRDIDIIIPVEDDEIEIDKEYLEDNYFDKKEVDYLISWQDIDGTEIE